MPRSALGLVLSSLALSFACAAEHEAAVRLADALVSRGDYARAAKTYESALSEMQALGADAAALRCETLIKLGGIRQGFLEDLDGALRAYRSAFACADPSVAREARLLTARLFRHRLHDPKAASRELTQLLQTGGEAEFSPAVLFEAAAYAFAAGEYERVRELVEPVIAREDPTLRTRARELLISVLLLEDRLPDALAALEPLRLETTEPQRRAALDFETARILEKLGRLDEAKLAYERAKGGAPSEAWLEARLAQLEEARVSREKEAAGARVAPRLGVRN